MKDFLPILIAAVVIATESVSGPLQIIVRTVDSEGAPVPDALFYDLVLGAHSPYFPPSSDTNGCVKLTSLTNSLGLSVRAEGFVSVMIKKEDLLIVGTNVVRLTRETTQGQQLPKRDSVPAAR